MVICNNVIITIRLYHVLIQAKNKLEYINRNILKFDTLHVKLEIFNQ